MRISVYRECELWLTLSLSCTLNFAEMGYFNPSYQDYTGYDLQDESEWLAVKSQTSLLPKNMITSVHEHISIFRKFNLALAFDTLRSIRIWISFHMIDHVDSKADKNKKLPSSNSPKQKWLCNSYLLPLNLQLLKAWIHSSFQVK